MRSKTIPDPRDGPTFTHELYLVDHLHTLSDSVTGKRVLFILWS